MAITTTFGADPSDIVTIQADTNPSGGSQPVTIVGYAVDIGGELADFAATNTQVGEFTGKH